MDTLFAKHDQYLQATPMDIVRDCMQDIDWEVPMLSIRGQKGVGKSTLIRQYIRQHYEAGDRQVLYCSLDSLYFSTHTLGDMVATFHRNGGRHLFLDEVHKYNQWSREIKEICDLYPDMRLVISGSSLLRLFSGDTDLSRRCVDYTIQGLSLREYLQFYKGINIPRFALEEILARPSEICAMVNQQTKPVAAFHDYLVNGYYPYYLRYAKSYQTVIEQVVNQVIDDELPNVCKIEPTNCRKVKALLSIISSSVPFEVDISKMSIQSGLQRNTIVEYLSHLQHAGLLNLLYADLMNVKRLQKPDKIYLENSNLLYALTGTAVQIGTARETFAVNQLSFRHRVEYGKKQGDYKVDGKYVFEVGGADKSFSQIADLPDSYVLADDIEYANGNKLPLWLIGFTY